MGAEQQGRRQLIGNAPPIRLLLRLGRQPPRLWPQLGDDVLDSCEIRLASTSWSSPDGGGARDAGPATSSNSGRRPRPERKGLVDHSLADEQERIVGEVGGVEQLHEIRSRTRWRLRR